MEMNSTRAAQLPRICAALISGLTCILCAVERGDIAYSYRFDTDAQRAQWPAAQFASWENTDSGTALKVQIAPTAEMKQYALSTPVDLVRFRGMKIVFQCVAKAREVTKPTEQWNGVKFMLHYKTPTKEYWLNQNDVHGTFDWRTLSFTATIADDATFGEIVLGLEKSSGTAWFTDIRAIVSRERPPIRVAATAVIPPYRGHDLPRLRGVMSPNAYSEDDFRVLANEWNANLIRWQMTYWGPPDAITNNDVYDAWLAGELADCEKAIDAARRYGMKLVVDLHSVPGGRITDNAHRALGLRMMQEKKFRDHFIKTWATIAKKFTGKKAVWAYDLINEPEDPLVPVPGLTTRDVQIDAAKAIRAVDQNTAIIIEAEEQDSPRGYRFIMPVDITNVIYEVHMYEPNRFTHQGIYGNPIGAAYPGMIDGKPFTKGTLREALAPVRDFQLAYNVHIYAGEFSAVRFAKGAAQYLKDCIDIFEEYGWDWSYHAFRESKNWSLEMENEPASVTEHRPASAPTDRLSVIRCAFSNNIRPSYE